MIHIARVNIQSRDRPSAGWQSVRSYESHFLCYAFLVAVYRTGVILGTARRSLAEGVRSSRNWTQLLQGRLLQFRSFKHRTDLSARCERQGER